MRKLFVILQMFICCSLMASSDVAAAPAQKSNGKNPCKDECKIECPVNPCPCFEQGDAPLEAMPMTCKYPAAYNHPAAIRVDGCWDVYSDISYIYWYAGEDGLDIATTAYTPDSTTHPSITDGRAVFQDTKYSSGFKIGLGADVHRDDWVVDLEYTYLRQHTNVSSGAAPSSTGGLGIFNFTGWFYEQFYAEGMIASSFHSRWKLGIDWLDLMFSRPYYQGRKLVIIPSAGLRASWIRQNLRVTAFDGYNVYEDSSSDAITLLSKNQSNSWAVGPRVLCNAHWLVGAGFRFQGNVGGSLLFTQFTTVSHYENGTAAVSLNPANFKLTDYNCLRPMMEANLGIGWGSYFSDLSYHLDLSATYDFNYLWGQNMMRYIAQLNAPGASSAINDLFLHGLTLKARFDF